LNLKEYSIKSILVDSKFMAGDRGWGTTERVSVWSSERLGVTSARNMASSVSGSPQGAAIAVASKATAK